MLGGRIVVLDVGKTHVKATLWNPRGSLRRREIYANVPTNAGTYGTLDVSGIERWLATTLRQFAADGPVDAIIPVAHGAAAALVSKGALFAPPFDYENEIPDTERQDYDRQRDPFEVTGSPALPCGLNLGAQLHFLERTTGPWPKDLQIIPWPQYWAWRLCGTAASEVTSLGCHTDLWRPAQREFSTLAQQRGWAARFAPLRSAAEVLGTLSVDWIERTGLPKTCRVHCGLHDSNAALVAARGHTKPDLDLTVLSTGTWFVAMRSLAKTAQIDLAQLPEKRDCLVNVDVRGRPVPSARFMGGREAQLLVELGEHPGAVEGLTSRIRALIEQRASVYPSFVHGVGPFPNEVGEWHRKPTDKLDVWVLTQAYLALMADTSLGLIGSTRQLLIEGRFAEDEIFTRMLATLRPEQKVYVGSNEDGLAYGALRLLDPSLMSPAPLRRVEPLDIDLSGYAEQWRSHVERRSA